MGLSVEIVDDIARDKTEKAIWDGFINGLFVAANRVHSQAVQTSPILSGVLRLSHSMEVDEKKGEAQVFIPENSPASDYAPILELTSPPMHPSNSGSRIPWLRPSLYENADKCKEDIDKEIKKKL